MEKKFFDFIIHGGDYNPDQWIKTPEIWDEDMRLMKLAHVNSATINIFSWSLIEPEEGVYNFGWLDTMMDKLHENGISVTQATVSRDIKELGLFKVQGKDGVSKYAVSHVAENKGLKSSLKSILKEAVVDVEYAKEGYNFKQVPIN